MNMLCTLSYFFVNSISYQQQLLVEPNNSGNILIFLLVYYVIYLYFDYIDNIVQFIYIGIEMI